MFQLCICFCELMVNDSVPEEKKTVKREAKVI